MFNHIKVASKRTWPGRFSTKLGSRFIRFGL